MSVGKIGAFYLLRITVLDSLMSVVKLRIEGRLTGRSVEELRRSCDLHLLDEGKLLILDLADVNFADAEGIELLRDLQARNVTLQNVAPFLLLQLEGSKGGMLPPRTKVDMPEGNQ